ncbi:hypothetical protein EV356DRAFT_532813 [Viridothelium virens]|uniref:Uncharacterized protein n=1 Tax=Viridothelium virens TaxID=1048519 RepID=A0A6A6H8P7_VIRVR|nr:hypothetical protein EV356DRAFT_532813 [Viridothelium virens]
MQIAEILSDLTSLRVCDPSAALALVTARPESTSSASATSAKTDTSTDTDLSRAKDIVRLHYSVKVALQENDLSRELLDAREKVRHALASF